MEKTILAIIFFIFVSLTARDLFFKGSSASDDGSSYGPNGDIKKSIPSMKIKPSAGPTLKILYCYSCGYRRAFEEYSQLIHQRFPNINIIGDNYTPGFFRHKTVQFITLAKLAIIAMVIANINPFTSLGMNTPQFWFWMTQHKLYACLMTFFLSNTIEGQLMSSGAFEIFYNDVPVWSKLTNGRIPSPPEMYEIIENQNKLLANQMNDFDIHTLPGRLS